MGRPGESLKLASLKMVSNFSYRNFSRILQINLSLHFKVHDCQKECIHE